MFYLMEEVPPPPPPPPGPTDNSWVVKNMQSTIVDNSKGTYLSKILAFLRFAEENFAAMLHPDFLRDVVRDEDSRISKVIRQVCALHVLLSAKTDFRPRQVQDGLCSQLAKYAEGTKDQGIAGARNGVQCIIQWSTQRVPPAICAA